MDNTSNTNNGTAGTVADPTTNNTTGNTGTVQRTKARRGFAVIPVSRRREIASLGGKASHATGKGHEWNSEEAKRAGALGGRATGARRRTAPTGAR